MGGGGGGGRGGGCGSITFKPMTYYHMLYDLCESLAHHGFKKLAFLVCHGGNAPVAKLIS